MRLRNAVVGDLRNGVLHRSALPAIVLASTVAVLGYALMFLVAARTVGVTAPISRLLPRGPARDAGHGAAEHRRLGAAGRERPSGCSPRPASARLAGAATAVAYGVLVLAAFLPGASRARRGVAAPPAGASPGCAAGQSSSRKEPRMRERPYTLLSCCVSIDGYIGNAASRLLLSNDADFDRVDAVRASCDAILVGAETVRVDNPRLLVRSQTRRDERAARGLPASPIKVTVTRRAELDARADFFRIGDAEKLVYCASPGVADARERLGPVATVVDGGGESVEMRALSSDLAERGVERLMVEGGGTVHTQFLTEDIVDELQLTVAPVFVGDSEAPRFVRDGVFPWNPSRRAELVDVRKLGDVVLLRYALSSRFEDAVSDGAPPHRDDPHPGRAAAAVRRTGT